MKHVKLYFWSNDKKYPKAEKAPGDYFVTSTGKRYCYRIKTLNVTDEFYKWLDEGAYLPIYGDEEELKILEGRFKMRNWIPYHYKKDTND